MKIHSLTAIAIAVISTINALAFDKSDHEAAAVTRARQYFAYEHNKHASGAVTVKVEISVDKCDPIAGWSGEYRTEGKALMQIYASQGGVRNETCRFEIVTKEKEQGIEVGSVTPKL